MAGGQKQKTEPNLQSEQLGARLRHARLAAGLQMRELADAAGCSESYISKIEADKTVPSLAMLHRLASALGLNMSTFFNEQISFGPVRIVKANAGPRIATPGFCEKCGIAIEGLVVPAKSGLLQVNIHHVELGGASEGFISHKGEEFGLVLKGKLNLKVNGTSYRLNQGDSFSFSSELPHAYENAGETRLSILWVNTPPTF